MKVISKIICILYVSLSVTITTQSQKLAKTDIVYANSYTYFPAIIADLSKPTTISSKYPGSLKYTAGDELSNLKANIEPTFAIGGKWLFSGSEYRIILACNGATNVNEGKGRNITENVPNSATSWNAKITRYVRDYEVYIPASLVVLHNNDTLKIIALSTVASPVNVVFHKALVDAGTKANNSGVVGFENDIEAEKYLPRAAKIVEQEAYISILQKAADVQRHLLKNYLTNGESTIVGIIKKKKRNFNYDDCDTLIDNYKIALKAVKEPSASTDSMFNNCIRGFEKLLASSEERIDANVKELLYYNLSNCYARVGDIEKSTAALNKAAQTLEKYEPSMIAAVRYYLQEMELRKLLQQGKYISLVK